RMAAVVALRGSPHHRELSVGRLDGHDLTLRVVRVRPIRAPHRHEPRIESDLRGEGIARRRMRLTLTHTLSFEANASPFSALDLDRLPKPMWEQTAGGNRFPKSA